MPFRPCVSGCGRYLAPGDGHDRCLSCLGIEHAEAAFVDESCPHCGWMTVAGLRTRLRFLQRGGVPVPLPRSRIPPGGYRGEATSGSSRAGLTVTVRNSPKTARAPPVTGTSLPMELPRERAGPSHGGGVPLVSFGAPPDDRMSIATLEGESDQSGDDGSVPLPPSGRSVVPDSDPEMVAMLARAAESVGLEWRPPLCPEPSRLGAGSQGPTPVPFFPEVHDELTGTWTAPFTPEGTGGCERVKLELHSPSSLASGQLWAVREGGQSHYSRTLCQNAGKCVTHADPASDRQRDARAGSLRSPSLPHRGYVTLTPWSGTCSSNGALLTEKTPGDARSESCYPSCSKGWSEGCLPPPSRSTWPRLLPTTTLWKGSRWGSMTGSSGSLGGLEGWILHAPPLYPLGTCP